MLSYRTLLARPGVARLMGAAALSRITTSMFGLSVLLSVLRARGSYAAAGSVLTCHALALAFFAPVSGRLADRFGPRPALAVAILVHAMGYGALLVALGLDAPLPVLGLAAMITGASTPPASPVTRAQWPSLISADSLRSIYAMDAALNSAAFVVGPLVVAAVTLVVSPHVTLVLAGCAKITGDLVLATSPTLARAPVKGGRDAKGAEAAGAKRRGDARRFLGPVADPQVFLLLAITSLDAFTFGAMQVGGAAAMNGGGETGLLSSALAIGEVAGGLVFGARVWVGTARSQLTALHLGAGIVLALTSAVRGLVGLGSFYLVAGLLGGARDSLDQTALGDAAPEGYRTEAFAWLATFMWSGYGAGTFVSGQMQAHAGTPAVYLGGAAASMLAALLATRLRVLSPRPA